MRTWACARRLSKRAALLALLAIVAQTALPYLHAIEVACSSHQSCPTDDAGHSAQTPAHPDDCAICGALAHSDARPSDSAPLLPARFVPRISLGLPPELTVLATSRPFEAASARGPPSLSAA